jgi:phenylacetic acid degradation protein PaaD
MALLEVAPGRSRVAMRVTPQMANGHGICHGGMIFALADSAFAFASNSRGGNVVAAGATVDFISPATVGEELEATATERHLQGRSGIYDVTVRESMSQRLVAEFRGRSRGLPTGEPSIRESH